MALIAKVTTKNAVPPLAADTYTARCIGVVDMGEQHSEKFNNWLHKVLLIFEVSGETVNVDGEDKPRWLSKEFTLSLSEKSSLFKTITAWFNRNLNAEESANGFDLAQLLNRPAMLTVAVVEKPDAKYNAITTITAVPKSIKVPEAESDEIFFDISEWDDKGFEKLPGWIQNRIKSSAEYQKRLPQGIDEIDIPEEYTAGGKAAAAQADQDIPF